MVKNWSGYNLAQQNEIFIFLDRLPEAVIQAVGDKDLWTGKGRPPRKLYDILICLSIQAYVGFSDRRSIGIIELFTTFAKIPIDIPSYRSLSNYRNDPRIKPYVNRVLEILTKPLSKVEKDFSTDSSGVSTKTHSSWYTITTGKESKRRDHITAHVTTSRILNAAVAVDINCNRGKDNQYLREHVHKVRNNFGVNDWCGDGMYASRANCIAVSKAGGRPWFKPRKDITTRTRASNSPSWKKMVKEFREDTDNANRHYHKRSNSESTFHAKKTKFGNSVRSRSNAAKENEELIKWIPYNLSVLSRGWFEFGIQPKFG